MLGKRAVWTKKIRANALAAAGDTCEICGVEEVRLICHDKWLYDDDKCTATLIGFEIHCGSCDSVTHLGRAIQCGVPQEVFIAAGEHICQVNGVKPSTALSILKSSIDLWQNRNAKRWEVAVSPSLLKAYPELKELPQFRPAKREY
jgi:hypothetical protein